jgi:hypothetical protein
VGISFTNSRTPANVTLRPDHLRKANRSGGRRNVNRWFDAAAFGPLSAGPGRFGSSVKGTIKGPGVNAWHAGFFKAFPTAERMLLRWELTATDFFNHGNFSNPATNISQLANVGVSSGAGGVNGSSAGDQPGPRAFRMGPRLES